MRNAKKKESMAQRKIKAAAQTAYEGAQMVGLAENVCKAIIIKMLKKNKRKSCYKGIQSKHCRS